MVGYSWSYLFQSPFSFLITSKRQNVTGFALQDVAQLLQGGKGDSERLARLQAPQRGMADARLFGQPIERSPVQQLIKSEFNHDGVFLAAKIYHAHEILSSRDIFR